MGYIYSRIYTWWGTQVEYIHGDIYGGVYGGVLGRVHLVEYT